MGQPNWLLGKKKSWTCEAPLNVGNAEQCFFFPPILAALGPSIKKKKKPVQIEQGLFFLGKENAKVAIS
jgi:hypothetical protein